MTKFPELFTALAAPFESHEIKVRQTPGGRQLQYITARTAMNRLDNLLGPENWWDEYVPAQNSVLCKLTLRLPDGSIVTKADAGGYAGLSDLGDDDKSGFSDSFKRACAKFGVARYLYRDGVPQYSPEREPGMDEAAPEPTPNPTSSTTAAPPVAQKPANNRVRDRDNAIPRTGKALFAWTKDMEQKHAVNLLKYLNGWSKLQEFPARMIDWDNDQVALAYQEAIRKIQAMQPSRDEALEEALSN